VSTAPQGSGRGPADPDKFVVVQHAPAVSVTLAEEFGVKPGKDIDGVMTTALRRSASTASSTRRFSADLTIMEEASELVHRVTERRHAADDDELLAGVDQVSSRSSTPTDPRNVSTCKSPQQMLGAVIKTTSRRNRHRSEEDLQRLGDAVHGQEVRSVASRDGWRDGVPDVDAVLTTRELARLIRMRGLDLNMLEPIPRTTPLGERSSAGKLFGATGGVMEAAIRTAYFMITGEELGELASRPFAASKGVKEARSTIGGINVGVAVVSGLGNAEEAAQGDPGRP
jgi:iron only hydrogenase large subunit-like protein